MPLRDEAYEPLEWEDRVIDQQTGDVLVPGTPVNEVNLNRMESGILTSHLDVGLAALAALQLAAATQQEMEKLKNQRILQGEATITANQSNGYFRDFEPFIEISPPGLPQINTPNYDVILTPTVSDDLGRVGDLVVYDKTQNGFKVKMTGSAMVVVFIWTLINPRV
ncbi:hypothetical protein SK3146_02523 [Paenibacillus konkukensis]|uniref:Signal transduction protein n=1 Tax=Paenibacillus konkukensis TaxID=2020716 RepID=A0ABY4RND2_9BACL|nr:signal transduction protein [Paenibacillus konkukensis]UQZ83336.1 hypothetical protein SK3146_02523 [Paenibacillus konkukensis]